MPFCVRCGTKAQNTDLYCGQCGAPRSGLGALIGEPANRVPEIEQTRTVNWRWLFISIGIPIFLVNAGWCLLLVGHIFGQWSSAFLVSPSAYICFFALTASLLFPLKAMGEFRRMSLSGVISYAIALCVILLILSTVIWGSFPYGYDQQGYQRIRMIPFFPWPSLPFLSFP